MRGCSPEANASKLFVESASVTPNPLLEHSYALPADIEVLHESLRERALRFLKGIR